jgi:hypothetical protein
MQMSILNLSDRFSQIRLMLTVIMLVCFGLHLKKELTKFFEAKTTTAIKLESTENLKMPAISICAEQIFDFTVAGNFKFYSFYFTFIMGGNHLHTYLYYKTICSN